MSVSQNMMFNAYSGVISAVAALAGHRLVDGAWKAATGELPPDPNDPRTPAGEAFLWLGLNAVCIGGLGLLANRFAAQRWLKYSRDLPTTKTVHVRV